MNYRDVLHKVLSFLEAKPIVGGLDVSDSALHFVASASNFTASVRLMPDTMLQGRIQDENAFLEALQDLRRQILGRRAKTRMRINAVVSLSSVHIYTQVFSLPSLGGESLNKAVELNLKMALPGDTATYSGWEVLSDRGEIGKVEILSAFLDKSIADDLVKLLEKANFSTIAIESRGMSVARILKNSPGVDLRVPTIVVSADTSGLDVIIVRDGHLQFDYFNSWKDLQAEDKEISMENFHSIVTRSVNQVLNFYNAHWKDPVGAVLVAATGMKNEVITAINNNFGSKVRELPSPSSPPVTPEWFAALGGALRGRMPRRDDAELSLLGIAARAKFQREQVDHFLYFWRTLIPASFSVLLIILAASWLFLNSVQNSLESQSALRLSPAQNKEIDNFKAQATAFNQAVGYIKYIADSSHPKAPLLTKILDITGRHDITVNRLTFSNPGAQASFSGTAKSENDIKSFKNELSITPGISNVNLPITNIQKTGDIYTFSVTFTPTS